jgi:hypothetical protein
VAGDRTADQIQRDIEQARASLAVAVDQISYRTNPKRVVENTKASLVEKARTPQGKAVIGGAGALVLILIIRRIRKH